MSLRPTRMATDPRSSRSDRQGAVAPLTLRSMHLEKAQNRGIESYRLLPISRMPRLGYDNRLRFLDVRSELPHSGWRLIKIGVSRENQRWRRDLCEGFPGQIVQEELLDQGARTGGMFQLLPATDTFRACRPVGWPQLSKRRGHTVKVGTGDTGGCRSILAVRDASQATRDDQAQQSIWIGQGEVRRQESPRCSPKKVKPG